MSLAHQVVVVRPEVAPPSLLGAWIDSIQARIGADYDEMLAVVGYTGNGKSSLAWYLGHALDPTFDASRMALSSEHMHDLLSDVQRGEVVVLDEGVEGFYSRDSATRENKDMVRWLDVCRARGAILIVCMAHIRWLETRVRDDRARWAIEVPTRGLARVHHPVRKGAMDPEAETAFWRPLFEFRFPKPTGPDWERYQAVKQARVQSYDPRAERLERRSRGRKRNNSQA